MADASVWLVFLAFMIDYAVEIFHEALKKGKYTCFLSQDTRLPMMYLPDCLNATVQFLDAPRATLKQCTYNLAAIR